MTMATTVKTLVKLANELHAAYVDLSSFDSDSKALEMKRPATYNRREREAIRRGLDANVEDATDRLAIAIDRATLERLNEAEKAMGNNVYVFDGF